MKNKIFKINLIFLLSIFSIIKSYDEEKTETYKEAEKAIPTRFSKFFGIYVDPQYKSIYDEPVLVDENRNILPAFQYDFNPCRCVMNKDIKSEYDCDCFSDYKYLNSLFSSVKRERKFLEGFKD